MTKESLLQYCVLIDEIEDTKRRMVRYKNDIKRIERQLSDIESGEIVKDKVYGGEGGWQGFVIEGVPVPEYSKLKIILGNRRICLKNELDLFADQVVRLDKERYQVLEFIARLKEPEIRRIITLRCIERLKWHDVAKKMGAGYEKDAVRMAFARFLNKEF